VPQRLEYSGKDDKFRLLTGNNRTALSINVARITGCEALEVCTWAQVRTMRRQTLVLELVDERNALERVMLHFSHLEKETERIGENRYRLTLRYEQEDETELLIRVLSFGPALKVISPSKFRKRVKDRIERQMGLWSGE
jgi:predicted DNA-binding transcriptional regulator YafY